MFSKNEIESFLKKDRPTSFHKYNFRNLWTAESIENVKSKLPNPPRGFSHFMVFLSTIILSGCVFFFSRPSVKSIHIPSGTYVELQLSNAYDYGNFAKDARFLTCGFSTTEAKKLGCQYDVLVGKWLPSFCVDDNAIEEYQKDGSWLGYADENRTELLTVEEMSNSDVYYTSARDHIVHCAMLWRKQYQAFFEGRTVFDSIIASKEHTEHCAHFLVKMTDWSTEFRTMPIPVFVGQAGCFVKDGFQ